MKTKLLAESILEVLKTLGFFALIWLCGIIVFLNDNNVLLGAFVLFCFSFAVALEYRTRKSLYRE
jgi:positive regulator of sigma E activity